MDTAANTADQATHPQKTTTLTNNPVKLKNWSEAPLGKHVLVYLEKESLGSKWHVAITRAGVYGQKITTVGHMFSFDVPKILGYIDLPENIELP